MYSYDKSDNSTREVDDSDGGGGKNVGNGDGSGKHTTFQDEQNIRIESVVAVAMVTN